MTSAQRISHFNLHEQREVETADWLPAGTLYVGITAGASCPNNLIDDTVRRLFELRGVDVDALIAGLDARAAGA